MTYMLRNLDPKVVHAFREKCDENGLSMSVVLWAIIERGEFQLWWNSEGNVVRHSTGETSIYARLFIQAGFPERDVSPAAWEGTQEPPV